MGRGVDRIKPFALDVLHHVGRHVVAAVGDSGSEVGNLEGRGGHFALSDGDGDDAETGPCGRLVMLVVELSIRNQTAVLARQVDAELIAEAHGDHVVAPRVHGHLHGGIFLAVAHHVVEPPAEEAVARR